MGSYQVRVTFDENDWQDMVEGSPTSLRDPEIVRYYVSLGMIFLQERREGLRAIESSELQAMAQMAAKDETGDADEAEDRLEGTDAIDEEDGTSEEADE